MVCKFTNSSTDFFVFQCSLMLIFFLFNAYVETLNLFISLFFVFISLVLDIFLPMS
jgi:hypothetical protein